MCRKKGPKKENLSSLKNDGKFLRTNNNMKDNEEKQIKPSETKNKESKNAHLSTSTTTTAMTSTTTATSTTCRVCDLLEESICNPRRAIECVH